MKACLVRRHRITPRPWGVSRASQLGVPGVHCLGKGLGVTITFLGRLESVGQPAGARRRMLLSSCQAGFAFQEPEMVLLELLSKRSYKEPPPPRSGCASQDTLITSHLVSFIITYMLLFLFISLLSSPSLLYVSTLVLALLWKMKEKLMYLPWCWRVKGILSLLNPAWWRWQPVVGGPKGEDGSLLRVRVSSSGSPFQNGRFLPWLALKEMFLII